MLSLFSRNQGFYKETGSPLMLAFSGVLLGRLLQMTEPLTGIAYITAILLFTLVNWKKLIRMIQRLFRRSEPDADAPDMQ